MPEDANAKQKRLAVIGEKFEAMCSELNEAQTERIKTLEVLLTEKTDLLAAAIIAHTSLTEENNTLKEQISQLEAATQPKKKKSKEAEE